MSEIANYAKNQARITKSLTDIAKNNNVSYTGVINVYNRFNYRTHNGEDYNPEAEEKALKLTQRYFAIQKIKDSKN
ncbi:MAG: hypothetical protein ACP5NZ_02325 [Nanobdellota archaeon]